MPNALTRTLTTPIPQSQPLPGQVPNSAGGHAYEADMWTRFDRFLILGTEGGTFYATEQELTREAAAVVDQCVTVDPERAVGRIVEVSVKRLAPRNLQAIYALAVAASTPVHENRRHAYDAIHKVCRTGTDLYRFAGFIKLVGARSWGPGLRRGVSLAFTEPPVDTLALHAVKYRQREGWTYRDLLRLAHPSTTDPARAGVFDFMAGRGVALPLPPVINGFRALQSEDANEALALRVLADQPRFPWEAIPDRLRTLKVWEALIPNMPVMALTRQLATFARNKLLTPMGATEATIVGRLTDPETIRRSNVHPMAFLDAMLVHGSGGRVGLSRGEQYTPNGAIVDALQRSFMLAFDNVTPTGKRTYLALDVSGSMAGGLCAGSVALTPRAGSAALALVTAAVEPRHVIRGFTAGQSGGLRGWGTRDAVMTPLNFTSRSTLMDAIRAVDGLPFGGTDCSLPVLDAMHNGIDVDTFVVLTDSETWAGNIHPTVALRDYRRKTGIPARLVVVGMEGNRFTIADPADPLQMDVVGFSADTPNMISRFSAGEF